MKRTIFLFATLFCCIAHATETIKWYIDGNLYDTTTCESGEDITLPSLPSNFGYSFDGWAPAIYDMTTLDYTINASGTNADYGGASWSLNFSYGTVFGTRACTDQVSSTTTPPGTSGSGGYCWCSAQYFQPANSSMLYELIPSKWFYVTKENSVGMCSYGCAVNCINAFSNNASRRQKLYGIIQ